MEDGMGIIKVEEDPIVNAPTEEHSILPPMEGEEEQKTEDQPTNGQRKLCACGCGQPVKTHNYVWGHKSKTRITTVPMLAKELGVTTIDKTPMHFALEALDTQIEIAEEKLKRMKEVRQQMQELTDGEQD